MMVAVPWRKRVPGWVNVFISTLSGRQNPIPPRPWFLGPCQGLGICWRTALLANAGGICLQPGWCLRLSDWGGGWSKGRVKEADAIEIVYWLGSLGTVTTTESTDSSRSTRQRARDLGACQKVWTRIALKVLHLS